MLSPRAIAVQGLGFNVAQVAMQGLLPLASAAAAASIDTSVGGSRRHEGNPWLRQAREEDELLIALLQTMVWEM